MLTNPKICIFVNVESPQDSETGDRTKRVASANRLVCNVDIVGVNAAQLGQIQGFTLAYSVEIMRALYQKEKFVYFDGALYEVKTLGKAKSKMNMLLNVQESKDPETKTAVEEWIRGNV